MPEAQGGEGLGFLESCVLAEEAGRSAAAIPLVATLVLGAAPIAAFGSEALQRQVATRCLLGDDDPSGRARRARGGPDSPVHHGDCGRGRLAHHGHEDRCARRECSPDALGRAPAAPQTGEAELFVVPCDAERVSRTRAGPDQWPARGRGRARRGQASAAKTLLARAAGPAEGPDVEGNLRWLLERAEAALCVQRRAPARRPSR